MYRYIYAVFLVQFYLGQFVEARPEFTPAQMPDVCAGQRFCTEKNNDYPEELIESLLLDVSDLWQEVSNETVPAKRQGGFYDNQCKSRPISEPIYKMLDENGNLRYVIQSKTRFNQIIHMEECLNPGEITEGTNSLTRSQVSQHTFECQQKHIDFKFLVLSLDGSKLEAVKMKDGVPVCCSCVLKTLARE